jgi:hypothetical protein
MSSIQIIRENTKSITYNEMPSIPFIIKTHETNGLYMVCKEPNRKDCYLVVHMYNGNSYVYNYDKTSVLSFLNNGEWKLLESILTVYE